MSSSQLPGPAIEPWAAKLQSEGFCIIPGLLPAEAIAALDAELADTFEATPFCEGNFYGERTKRFGRLLARSPRSEALVRHPLVLGVIEQVLGPWCDTIQLNLTQAIAVHPGALAQMPHRDQDMWRGPAGRIEYLVNVMWPFTPFRRENGATRLWPQTHGPMALEAEPSSSEFAAELDPGSALLFLGSTLHAAGSNRSNEVRRGMIAGYSLGWLKTYENQFLAYPPEIARNFGPELRALVGYRQHRPNLGNYEGRCPSLLLDDPDPGPLAAIDALTPEQVEAVDAHAAAEQCSARA